MGRHSRKPNQAPAVPQAPSETQLPAVAAWAGGDAVKTSSSHASKTSSSTVSSRRYGAVAALAAATALSVVAMTAEPAVPTAQAASFTAPMQIDTAEPDLSVDVIIVADGTAQLVNTEADTWGQVLSENGITVGEDDIVNVELSDPVVAHERVTVKRVTFEEVVEENTDEFETVRENDSTLEKGTEKVTAEGQDGVTRTTFRVKYVDGVEDSREETINVTVSERVDRVIAVGTKEPEPDPEPEPEPVAEAPAATTETQTQSAPAQTQAAPEPEPAQSQPVVVNKGGNKGIAQQMVANKGWNNSQFQCLETLWQRESGWNHLAQNPSSGAYGIPQSLPGSKMASHGADWRTNPATQIAWGLDYIQGRYGTPCGALNHSYSVGWY